MKLPVIEVSGSNYEIGFSHGQQAKKQIDVTVETYKNMFYEFSKIEWERAQKIALTFEEDIKAFNPDYIEEIHGIADGSGYKYEEILALNVRSELVFQGSHITSDGCTSVVVTGDRGVGGKTFLGQNWDWKVKMLEGIILLKIKKEGKADIATLTEAGIVGKIGCNANGVGVCFNALSVDEAPSGVPIHLVLREILEQPNLLEAMSVVTANKVGCPANVLIASKYGEALDFEIEVEDFEALYPIDGIMTHTNHYVNPRLPRVGHKDTASPKFPDTFIRRGRAEKIIRSVQGEIGMEDIKKVFCSHQDPSCAICHHEEHNGPSGGEIGTVASILMDLEAGKLYITAGVPCENEYVEYSVS
ncbi:MAG: acyl-CoA--6-aminopenicillanic acid acyl-transferase [Clostridia bacterium]|nr:C45 family autoproteolytic acyltransferase/hydrolase [Lachnospiraceae bacterium]NCB99333.1 acyl-CoA--6-aminopenicillanic acid acyl-transferase [Clostridia bacterium]NCD01564.1 acyl-CoA--6-aminopenicillanic acid acyl-transferase [Clostridia bacterium]